MKYTYFISCEFEIERQYWQDFSKIQPLFAVIEKYHIVRDFPLNKLPDIHENRLPMQEISLKIG
ncbi:MAG: hypothetical protein HOJ48_06825 [Desulfobacula sp.]|nr:hypothetical protein [Desulfobacula sp.]